MGWKFTGKIQTTGPTIFNHPEFQPPVSVTIMVDRPSCRHFKKKNVPQFWDEKQKEILKLPPRSCESKRRPKKMFQGSLFFRHQNMRKSTQRDDHGTCGECMFLWWSCPRSLPILPVGLQTWFAVYSQWTGPSSYLGFKDQCKRQSFIWLGILGVSTAIWIWVFFHCCGWIHISSRDESWDFCGSPCRCPWSIPVHPWSHGSLQICRW